MHNDHKKPIHIVRVEVSNFRRLTFAQVRIDKQVGLVRVTGPNAAGKSSLLAAIQATLGGAKLVGPATINGDNEQAATTLELSNGVTVERKYSADNPKGTLVVRSADGGRYSQSRLNDWLGPLAFDPLALFDLTPEKVTDTLLALGTDPELPRKLRDLRAQRKALYDGRTPFIVAARNARSAARPDGERPEAVDTSAEMKRLGELQQQQYQRDQQLRKREEVTAWIQQGRTAIATLEAKLVAAKAKLAELLDTDAQLDEALRQLPDRTVSIKAVQDHIADAQAVNDQLEPWKAYDRAQQVADEAERRVTEITARIDTCDAEKDELLVGAGIDIPGLSFDDDAEPLLNGQPLAVASGREKIDMAVAVAMRANPQLRIALVDEANDLDLDALARLDELAREHEFQVWAVRIGIEGPGEIVVENGVAVSGRAAAANAAQQAALL